MLDIRAAHQAYQAKEISNIEFVRSSANMADGLTKEKMQANLYNQLQCSKHTVPSVQWIMR